MPNTCWIRLTYFYKYVTNLAHSMGALQDVVYNQVEGDTRTLGELTKTWLAVSFCSPEGILPEFCNTLV